ESLSGQTVLRSTSRRSNELKVQRFISAGSGDSLQIGADLFVGSRIAEHLRVRLDAPAFAGLAICFRPPVAMFSQPFFAPLAPIHQNPRPALIAILDGFLGVVEFPQIPVASEARVQHFVGP